MAMPTNTRKPLEPQRQRQPSEPPPGARLPRRTSCDACANGLNRRGRYTSLYNSKANVDAPASHSRSRRPRRGDSNSLPCRPHQAPRRNASSSRAGCRYRPLGGTAIEDPCQAACRQRLALSLSCVIWGHFRRSPVLQSNPRRSVRAALLPRLAGQPVLCRHPLPQSCHFQRKRGCHMPSFMTCVYRQALPRPAPPP